MKYNPKLIRNFSIIAHIDHGKSTLADRLIEHTNVELKDLINNQFLDSLELEKKHGITIKLNYIELKYKAKDNQTYTLCMIDTPGHIDFTYEVSRSLATCEGALLVVDATQGIQAQTISNVDLALENNLEIIPIINKIDLNTANIENTKSEIENIIGLSCKNIPLISAKNDINITEVLETIIKKIPPPKDSITKKLKALVFDSYYDPFQGVIIYVRVFNGKISKNDDIYFINCEISAKVKNLFIKKIDLIEVKEIFAGQIGIISCNMKNISFSAIGDTITHLKTQNIIPLVGYKKLQSMVYSSFYPSDSHDYEKLKKSLQKIKLNDDSLFFESENSETLGFGFRCGFLGGLHLQIIKERLETEYNLDIISAIPSVKYKIYLKNKDFLTISNPAKFPKNELIDYIEEPMCKLTIITTNDYYGKIMDYTVSKRGVFIKNTLLSNDSQILEFSLPLSELIINYFDNIKSLSKGYATINYDFSGYQKSDVVKLNILLNGNVVNPLCVIVARSKAYKVGKIICEELKNIISKHSFEIPIQAAIGGKIVSRTTIKATRKNVTAKLYGGDVTRKMKLLEKQKKGKKRMRKFGKINLSSNVFVKLSHLNYDK